MAIYNEYRPLTLDKVRGQDTIKNQLKAMFESGSVPNALLFVGPRGTGKTTIARIVAKFVNCEDPHGDPCNECKSCKDILAGTSPDVVELDAASNNGVDDVREIVSNAQYAPIGKMKVYILDEVHMFSQAAWNALLKILEEPPKNVLFLLCTTEEQKIPATIISRCRKLYFERVDLNEIVELMEGICEEKGVAYDRDALLMVAKASEGCVRDALSILESFLDVDAVVASNVAATLGLSGEDVIFNILTGVVKGDALQAVDSLHKATSRGVSLSALVKSLIGAVADALFIKQGADIGAVLNTALYKERLAEFAGLVDTDRSLELINALSEIYGAISKTPDAGFMVEASLLRAVQYESELGKLKERVEQLEKTIADGVQVSACTPAATMPELTVTESPVGTTAAPSDSGFGMNEPVDDECPFDEDPEPEFFETPAPAGDSEWASADEDVFSSIESVEIGAAIDLFGGDETPSEEAPAPAPADEPVSEPEEEPESEPYIKTGADIPAFNAGSLAGFLWQ